MINNFFPRRTCTSALWGLAAFEAEGAAPHVATSRTDIATRHRHDSDKVTRDKRVIIADNHSGTRFRSIRALGHHPTRAQPLYMKDRVSSPPHVVHGGPIAVWRIGLLLHPVLPQEYLR